MSIQRAAQPDTGTPFVYPMTPEEGSSPTNRRKRRQPPNGSGTVPIGEPGLRRWSSPSPLQLRRGSSRPSVVSSEGNCL